MASLTRADLQNKHLANLNGQLQLVQTEPFIEEFNQQYLDDPKSEQRLIKISKFRE